MLVIFLLTVAICTLVCTWIRIQIEQWTSDARMSRLALKRRNVFLDEPRSATESLNVVEISEDEAEPMDTKCGPDDTTGARGALAGCRGGTPSCDYLNQKSSDQKGQDCHSNDFDVSTDSLETDEETEDKIVFAMAREPKKERPSLTSWLDKGKRSKQREERRNLWQAAGSQNDHGAFHSQPRQFREDAEDWKTEKNETVEEEDVPLVAIQHEITIAGTKVKLPVKPYPCQTAVMNMLIKACAKEQNCLLESPTGSGKTLALLCGVLAWQERYAAEVRAQQWKATEKMPGTCPSIGGGTCAEKLIETSGSLTAEFAARCCELEDSKAEGKRARVPKVYYGTRTHKQIEQVIRELKKTDYKWKKMTILSSREHTCIQNSKKNKTELCNELLDPTKPSHCPFYTENNKRAIVSFSALERTKLRSAWDIEDLVSLGKEREVCPYFAARNLMQEADVIFCPYNYLIDPDIRASMAINLVNQIIILDEAHNIEDICRDAASVEFREDDLTAIVQECKTLAKNERALPAYNTIGEYIAGLLAFIRLISLQRIDNTENLSSPCWTGTELTELFNINDIGKSKHQPFLNASAMAIEEYNLARDSTYKSPNHAPHPIISQSTKRIIEQLGFVIAVLYSEKYVNDYRACIVEEAVKNVKGENAPDNTWMPMARNTERIRTLKLMCMSPAVIFEPLSNSARSIILASGTLTPTASFQSELGTQFPHVLSANHVIPKDQVYVTCIPKGPTGVPLKANYQNVNSWSFQDELGRLLLDVCEAVPHGVLCFFSSYQVMHTQLQRWRTSSVWEKILCLKNTFLEPRYGGDLAKIMRDYREAIQYTSDGTKGTLNGALFLAVFRGKVAEGIDFSDNEARCVLTIGIPYAVRRDPVTDMKIKYNDINVSKGLLKGGEWYTIQAFRALNQALGRCLRHKNDWGAVLLVDERLRQDQNVCYLPKWIKSMWVEQNMNTLKKDLSNFVTRQIERERVNYATPKMEYEESAGE